MDVKHLYDIPNYWGQKVVLKVDLPKYQYTMRDVKSGMVFLGYSNELSELNARTMVQAFLSDLSKQAPFRMQDVTIQTDNGSEFAAQQGTLKEPLSPNLFTHLNVNISLFLQVVATQTQT